MRTLVLATSLLGASSCGRSVHAEVPRPVPDLPAVPWLNGAPTTLGALRGKVVLVEFWTFACSNCQAVEPHVKEWYSRWADRGFVVIGVHAPEQDFERDEARLRDYVAQHQIAYPIAIDADHEIWRRFGVWAWPSLYLVDKNGQIRFEHIGEGAYGEIEQRIEALLDEPGDALSSGAAANR